MTLILFSSLPAFSQPPVWIPKAENVLPPNYEITNTYIVDDQIIWVTAIDWSELNNSPVSPNHVIKVMKSTNGGENWVVFDVEEAMGRISFDIHAFNDQKAWITTQNLISGAGRGLFLTTDGGETWTEKLNGTAGGGSLHFFDSMSAYCGVYDIIKITTDGGETWNDAASIPPFLPGEGGTSYSGAANEAVIGDTIWGGTGKGRVFRSIDRGNNWTVVNSDASTNIPSIAFANAQVGLLVRDNGDMSRSTDGGETWIPLDCEYDIFELIRIPGTKTILGTSYQYLGIGENKTVYSDDFGESWAKLDSVVTAYAPVFSSPTHGWVGGLRPAADSPALYKWNSDELVSVNDLLAKSARINVFPNPFSSFINISTEDVAIKSIRLLDMEGCVHATYQGQETSAFSWELSGLASGIYFLEIKTTGGFIIKKIVK